MKYHTNPTAARQTSLFRQIDWFTTLVPFLCILALCAWFVVSPESSTNTISAIRNFLGDEMGSYYLIIGLGVFVCSLYIAFSRFGKIRLGETDKPLYSGFQWGSMIFTAGLAADILFYSCCEWILYASDPHTAEMGTLHEWAATYPLGTDSLGLLSGAVRSLRLHASCPQTDQTEIFCGLPSGPGK